uniref:Lon proteolytic domain-containing protein n=1 Tax=viral metagenome TaxID=1070528 RepID=A0A6C0IYB5_9ZZZZ
MMPNLKNILNNKNKLEKLILLQRNFKKILNYKNNIRFQLDHFLNICSYIINQINHKFDLKIIDYSEYNIGLSAIYDLVKEIDILNNLSIKELLKLSKFKILLNLVKFNLTIKKYILKYGLKDLIQICKFLCIENCLSSEFLTFYNDLFCPTGLTIYKFEHNQYKNIHDKDNVLDFDVIIKTPIIKLFNSDKIYYKLHGCKIFLPIANMMYLFNGYFITDHINILKKQKNFIKKYNDLIQLLIQTKFESLYIKNYINNLSLRDFIVNNNNDLIDKVNNNYKELIRIKKTDINIIIKEFINNNMLYHINTINNLLLQPNNLMNLNLIDLLLDLLKNDTNYDYTFFYKLLPNSSKLFIENLKKKYKLQNIKISLSYEKKIELMNCSQNIKNKVMSRLKEYNNSKNNDVNSKAQKFLDGFISIPFNIYKKPYIISKFETINNTNSLNIIKHSINNVNYNVLFSPFVEKIVSDLNNFNDGRKNAIGYNIFYYNLKKNLNNIYNLKLKILDIVDDNDFIKLFKLVDLKNICKKLNIPIKKKKLDMSNNILNYEVTITQINVIKNILKVKDNILNVNNLYSKLIDFTNIWENYQKEQIKYLNYVDKTLNDTIYGLETSKREIKRIIAQWITGTNKGYVLGLEGPPGVGKTTIAKKGIAKCLIDEDETTRPFIFISVGGSANGTTLEGHNYTYVGSSWGKIVDGLIECKCMNPIIYIDELDKVSNTLQGKEIIGILTHLTDSSQNDQFNDKYFANIPIDLSKSLIIFSYNDYNAIDKILMDRIHRIKIDPLSVLEKEIIVEKYILPELLNTIGFTTDSIIIDKISIKHIINKYTNESGVRKLKEKICELLREVNLQYIDNKISLPFNIDVEFIDKIFINHCRIDIKKIYEKPLVGVINGLYASSNGLGGITIIEVFKKYTSNFLTLELTGNQGSVMKESMSVAKTLAWNLLNKELQNKILENKNYGIHIHCPDTSTQKDGPSAGTAITLAILSLFTGCPIKNTVAITGEIDLNGNVLKIGGLENKILGAKKANVLDVICPAENTEDLKKIRRNKLNIESESFNIHMVKNLKETIDYIFDKSIYKYLNI